MGVKILRWITESLKQPLQPRYGVVGFGVIIYAKGFEKNIKL